MPKEATPGGLQPTIADLAFPCFLVRILELDVGAATQLPEQEQTSPGSGS
jgi:hypothetical protein